ncbi:MAG TPA: hypothetical protein DDW36_01350 [Candidatus Magasanikbacteria bacterium]|nr:hypothetical protein [Candidatus Magasanikbacteria bacterium]
MTRLTPEKQAYITLTLSLLTIALVVALITIPTYTRLQSVHAQTDALQTMLENQYAKTQQLRKSNIKLPQIKNVVNAWDNALLTPETELQFIRFVEGLAQLNDLNIKLDPKPIDAKMPQLKLGFTLDMQLTGGFEGIMNFLSGLEQADYYLSLNTVELKRVEDNPTSHNLFVHIFGTIYVR